MKKSIFGFITLLVFVVSANAQLPNSENTQGTNVVKIDPVPLITSTLKASYEYASNDEISAQINASYTFGIDIADVDFDGFGIGAEGRYYISKDSYAPAGFYIGSFIHFNSLKVEDAEGDPDKLRIYRIGGFIGNQWVWNGRICFDLNIGGEYAKAKAFDVEITDDDYENSVEGYLPKFAAAIGYNF